MKCLKLLLIITIIVFVISCNNKENSVQDNLSLFDDSSFGLTQQLNESDDFIISDKVYLPYGMHTFDSLLIVVEGMVDSNIISIYNSNSLELMNSFGQKGGGPKEFSEAPSVFISSNSSEILQLYDWERKRLIGISLKKLILSDSIEIEYEYHLPPEIIDAQKVQKIGNNIIAGGFLSNGFAAFVNDSTLEIKYITYERLPKVKDLNYRERKWFYNSWLAINNSREKIVFAMERSNQIMIYNFDGTLDRIIRNRFFTPNYNLDREDVPYYYTNVVVTDSLIYASWIGKSANEIEKTITTGGVPKSELHIFDWNGRPLKKLNLGDQFITFLEVDTFNKRFFIINEFSETSLLKSFYSDFIK